MRKIILIITLIIPLASALIEVNTTKHYENDTIIIDELNIKIILVNEQGIYINNTGKGQIISIGECIESTNHELCLTTADNQSAEITYYKENKTVSIELEVTEEVNVGEEIKAEVTIENTYDETKHLNTNISTNLGVINDNTIDIELKPGERRKITKKYFAPTKGEYYIAIKYDNTSINKTINTNDYLTIEHDYTPNITIGETYNYTLTITSENQSSVTIKITPPEKLIIDNKNNKQITEEIMLNKTAQINFSYKAEEEINNYIQIQITDDITRTIYQPIRTNSFKKPQLITSKELTLTEGQQVIPIKIYNPNKQELEVELEIKGTLYNLTKTIKIPESSTSQENITIHPQANNNYLLLLELKYNDPNNKPLITTESISINTIKKAQDNNIKQTNNTTNNTIQEHSNQNTTLQETSQEIITNKTINSSESEQKQENEQKSTAQEVTNNNTSYLLYLAILLLGLLTILGVTATRIKKQHDLEEYISLLESWTPKTQQEYELKQKLLRELEKK